MEVKVIVDGVPRVVCGVTEKTTCEEVVISLAQAIGQPGRYTLREKFKDFERSLTPSEHVLESLSRYGQQAREVQLILLRSGPSFWEDMNHAKVGRYQPGPQMRRNEAGVRMRRGSGSLSLHRRSLPPVARLEQQAEEQMEEMKTPKRKSLTLMEEAWVWLENLRKGGAHHSATDKEFSRETDKQKDSSLDITVAKETSAPGGLLSKIRGQRSGRSNADRQISCCMGQQAKDKDTKRSKKTQVPEIKADDPSVLSSENKIADCKRNLRESTMRQLAYLQDLQVQIASADEQMRELEERQWARKAEQEAQQKIIEEEAEQLQFWENELKAEVGYEKDLQGQFLEMKEKAMECKSKLEEYKQKLQGLDFYGFQKPSHKENGTDQRISDTFTTAEILPVSNNVKQPSSKPKGEANKPAFKEDFDPPQAIVHPNQIRERRSTGPAELKEWWARWSEAQSAKLNSEPKVIHRTELTIRLGSTRV